MTRSHEENDSIGGVVTSRRCDCCGHHEIGVATAAGDFVALRPGMRVHIEKAAGRLENGPFERDPE